MRILRRPARVHLGRRRYTALLGLVAAFVMVCAGLVAAPLAGAAPLPTRLYVDSHVLAPQSGPYAHLRSIPQARWFTGGISAEQARAEMSTYIGEAKAANSRPVIVLYAIPGRDCGSYSAGGMQSAGEYQRWITTISTALIGARAMVVLEPDAIAGSGSCGGTERLQLLRWATKKLAKTGSWVYLDAGHSAWVPEKTMTKRLRTAGVKWARGVSLNVSNYRTTVAEKRYGKAIVARLKRAGIKGKKVVIDVSRNGAKPKSTEWCNPTWARLGPRPKLTPKHKLTDGLLWIKRPGESDGPCNSGPNAGEWSDLLASRLTAS